MNRQKIVSLMILIVILSMMLLNLFISSTYAINNREYQVTVSVKYGQSDARNMLKMINNLRTEENIRSLVYSYDLEQIAMQRAAEIAISYSHTRPNGQWYNSVTYHGVRSYCENILVGYGKNSEGAFNEWKGTAEEYLNNVTRKNMLNGRYISVGIAHVTYNGVDYWVQEFGVSTDRCVTNPLDRYDNRNVFVDSSKITSMKNTVSKSEFDLEIGEEAELPTLETTILVQNGFGGNKNVIIPYSWSIENRRVAKIVGNKIVPLMVGTTNLKAIVGNEVILIPIKVLEKTVEGSVITLSESRCAYDGTEKKPDVTVVSARGKTVSPDQYDVSYENNVEVGTATITITGKGEYIGKNTINFEIYCPHTNTEVRNSKNATCTESGYTGDIYCTHCEALVENGNEIALLPHRYAEEFETDGEHHSKKCLDCGNCIEDVHQYTEEYETDELYHIKRCTVCGYTVKEEHRGTPATCSSKAKCEVCNVSYGEVSSVHTGDTDVKDYIAPTCTVKGFTGIKYCKECKGIVELGRVIPALGHKGGKATCSSKAKCEVCNEEYGEIDKEYHLNVELRNATEVNGEIGGYTGDLYCKDCEKVVKQGTAILPLLEEKEPETPVVEDVANDRNVKSGIEEINNVKKNQGVATEESKGNTAAVVTAGVGVTTVVSLGAIEITKAKAAGSVAGQISKMRKARTLKKINKMHGRH